LVRAATRSPADIGVVAFFATVPYIPGAIVDRHSGRPTP
jgi:hypothetical protein